MSRCKGDVNYDKMNLTFALSLRLTQLITFFSQLQIPVFQTEEDIHELAQHIVLDRVLILRILGSMNFASYAGVEKQIIEELQKEALWESTVKTTSKPTGKRIFQSLLLKRRLMNSHKTVDPETAEETMIPKALEGLTSAAYRDHVTAEIILILRQNVSITCNSVNYFS